MSKLQIVGLAVAFVALALMAVIRVKRISPMAWGFYGPVYQEDGVAIHGFDTVAYHVGGKATEGSPDFSATWKGATWLFSNAENKARFEKAPEKYAPAYGGFCSFAASKGFTAKCDSGTWRIEGGQLYLFNDESMRNNWDSELGQGVIAKGQAHWAKRPQ